MLARLGAATVDSLWLPVLVWTALVLPAWALLARSSAQPLLQYRLRQALLAALPMGIAATSVLDGSGWVAASLPQGLQPVPSVPVDTGGDLVQTGAASSTVSTSAPPVWSWTQALGAATLVALGGAFVGVGTLVRDLLAFTRFRRTEETVPAPEAQKQVDVLRQRLSIRRPVRVSIAPHDVVPMTLAGWPATILVPRHLTDRPAALRMTLRHECVHICRWDDLAHVVERGLASLFTALPVVGWLQQSISRYREQACDAAVLDDRTIRASSYAKLLMTIADQSGPSPTATLSLSDPPSSLKTRLRAMRHYTSPLPARWTSGIAIAVLGALTLGIVACSDSAAPPSPSTDEAAVSSATWTPVQDARAAGDAWLAQLHAGDADGSYAAASPMLASVSRADWTTWVQSRQSTVGNVQSMRFMGARLNTGLGPPNAPSVMLRYVLSYTSGVQCQPAVVMAWVDASWKVSAYGPNSCSDQPFPQGASSARTVSSSDRLPTPVSGSPLLERPTGALQHEVHPSEIGDDIQLPAQVTVEFTVGADGHVADAQSASDDAPDALVSSALQSVESLRYEPGRRDGELVATAMHVPVTFLPPSPQDQ
jgi:beta-lactamase regulating signal transducer with metallopeptidase domain